MEDKVRRLDHDLGLDRPEEQDICSRKELTQICAEVNGSPRFSITLYLSYQKGRKTGLMVLATESDDRNLYMEYPCIHLERSTS